MATKAQLRKIRQEEELQRPPEVLTYYQQFYKDVLHTGSRVICNPPPTETDDDWVLLCHTGMSSPVEGFLTQEGFNKGGSADATESSFSSLKKHLSKSDGWGTPQDVLNVILTENTEFFSRFKTATEITRELNILEKPIRIEVFKAIHGDVWPKSLEEVRAFYTTRKEEYKKEQEELEKNLRRDYKSKTYQYFGTSGTTTAGTVTHRIINPNVVPELRLEAGAVNWAQAEVFGENRANQALNDMRQLNAIRMADLERVIFNQPVIADF